jgi:hypothetical protein
MAHRGLLLVTLCAYAHTRCGEAAIDIMTLVASDALALDVDEMTR